MANLTLELNVNSASNLVNVNLITKMDVYAVITIRGDDTRKKQKVKTTVDHSGGSNPTWNHAVKLSVNERLVRDGRLTLVMRLKSRRILGNKDIGGVNVPLLELLNSITPSVESDSYNQEMKVMSYQVRTSSGKRSGSLTFSYRFKPDFPAIVNWNSVDMEDFPLTAYPSPASTEHAPSAPPELSTKYPNMSQQSYQNVFDHRKHLFAVGSSNDPLPISYDAVSTKQPGSSSYNKYDFTYNHVPPLPSHQEYGSYGYVPPSTPEYRYGGPSYNQPREIGLCFGLGTGLLGGLIIGDIVSDVAKCFDLSL